MDIIKFNGETSPTKLEKGEIVNNIKTKLWVERYSKAGEFKLTASVSTGLRDLLPLGSIISHLDTEEVMIVENHEIVESHSQDSEITITGRGFESFFENRIVGANKAFPTNTGSSDYILAPNPVWTQVIDIIEEHTKSTRVYSSDDAIEYMTLYTDLVGAGDPVERIIKRGELYSRVLELLDVGDLGIKVVRPGPWSPLGLASPDMAVVIHEGVDRTQEMVFSYDTGEIESADYLWSIKKLKNTAMISGKWVETLVTTEEHNYDRRMLYVNADDIDQELDASPTGTQYNDIVAAMQQRGLEALAAQKQIALSKAELSDTANTKHYRTDFNTGDIITVNGGYNQTTSKRISEYVEIEDENGQKGYPTLADI